MEKRRDVRFQTKLYVRLKSETLTSWGLLIDVSVNGIFLQCNRDFPAGAHIELEIFMPDNSVSFLKGIVKRKVLMPDTSRKYGLGVKLTEKGTLFSYFLRLLQEQIALRAQTSPAAQEHHTTV